LRDRYDYSNRLAALLPNGMSQAADQLRRKCALPFPARPETAIVMISAGPSGLNLIHGSIALLDTSPPSTPRIEEFLKSKSYVTSLGDPAFKTLHDAASLQWKTEESLRLDYLRLTTCPDAQYMSVFVDRLRSCAATPANVHYADLLADEKV